MYFVVCLYETVVVAECLSYDEASMALEDAVRESDGFYTEDDFAIMTDEELEDYGLMN